MKTLALISAVLMLAGCAPVLDRNLMDQGQRNFPLNELRGNPDAYKGKLYILGGVIVETKFTPDGSQIEVLSTPVDKSGGLEDGQRTMGRFLAVFPKDQGLLDPLIYKKGRAVTIAGEFVETRKNKIDNYEYLYPVFRIRQIHLWEEWNYVQYPYPYPNYPYPYAFHPYWYNPYWGPWPPPAGWW
jgi:outer membrane lipoprotein